MEGSLLSKGILSIITFYLAPATCQEAEEIMEVGAPWGHSPHGASFGSVCYMVAIFKKGCGLIKGEKLELGVSGGREKVAVSIL